MKNLPKVVKIGETTYTFKDNVRGLEFLASVEDEERREGLKTIANLIAQVSDSPKLSQKDVLMKPFAEFLQLIAAFCEIYGLPKKFSFLE